MNLLTDGIKMRAVVKTENTKKIFIGNRTQIYPVYQIRMDLLYFNDQNDRIATWISQYKAEHEVSPLQELARDEYNAIIQKFIVDSNADAIRKTEKNIELIGQREAGVVLTDGRIIDGNRRFTCLRNIQDRTGHIQYFEAVILDQDVTQNAKEIKMLELYLQHGVDKPVDYDPVDRLVGIYNDIAINHLLTVKEYAASTGQKEKDIEREVEKAKLMVEYLEFIQMPMQFHIARRTSLNAPLHELHTILHQCKDDDKREDLKNVVFANFAMQPFGDMTRYIRKIKKIVSNARLLDGYLEEQLDLTEQVCDKIEAQPAMSETVLNEQIRGDIQLQDRFAHSTEKSIAKVDSDASRNRPAQQAEKAYEMLDDIDTNIFKKLGEAQKDDIRDKLTLIQEILDSIRSELDV
ncbi:MAG: hypothetical protein R3Y06_09565 [Faecalibacterium sp.]